MKQSLIAFLFTLLPLFLLAQDRQVRPTVSGKIVDKISGQPVGWASIWSYEDGKPRVLKVSYTKPDGSVAWQAPRTGSYKLVFRADGYLIDSLVVNLVANTKLEPIRLLPDLETNTRQLEEATVTADRPLLAHLIDRYVYDVSRDPEAKRKKMTEIIEKIPGIDANTPTGLLEYYGTRFTQVLIDGEQHALIHSHLQFPMRLIRGDVMSKVEIIPPGSPQYNNERPILNIITSRPLPNGFGVEVSGDANTEQAYNGKFDFVSKIRDAVIFSVGYDLGHSDRPKLHNYSTRELFNTAGSTGSQQSEGVLESYSRSHKFRFASSFKILGNTLYLNANTSLGENGSSNNLATAFLDAAGVQQNRQETKSNNKNKTVPRLGLGARYEITFPNKYRLGFNYTYSDSYSEGEYSTLTHHTPSNEQSGRHSGTATGAKEHAARIILNPPVRPTKHSFNADVQFAHRQYSNLSDYWLWDEMVGDYARDLEWNNGLSYTQRIANARISYHFSSKKFMVGLRLIGGYESNQGIFYNPAPSPLDYGFVQMNPSTSGMWRPNTNFGLGFSYSNSTIRPGVEKLNPYLDDSDPLNLRTGNPLLQPENSHTFLIGPMLHFLRKYKINITLPQISYTIITNAIEQVTTVSTEGVGLTSYANLGKRNSLDIFCPISLNMIKWVSLSVSPSYRHITYKSSNPDVGTNTVQSLSLSLSAKLSPWKGGSVSCSYSLQSGIATAQSTKMNYYNDFSFRWQQTILKNKLFATLSLDNPFESRRYISNTISGSGFIYTDRREQLGRVFMLTLRTNFGRFKDKIAEQSDIFQDRGRTEGQSINTP